MRASLALAPAGIMLAGALSFAACADEPAGSLYVTSGQTDEVVRLRADDGSVLRRIPVNRLRLKTDEPHAVAVSPDGAHWYVTVAHGEPSLWKFETADDRLVGRVDLPSGGAAMIGMSRDGATAYIPDYDRAGEREGRVAAVRLRDLAVLAHAGVCGTAHDAAVHPEGFLVAVACAGSDEIVFLDPITLVVTARFPSPALSVSPHASPGGHAGATGSRPLSVVWSPNGAILAVALHAVDAVWLLDRDGATIATVPVGAGPAQLAFADDRTIVSANRMGGSLSVIDVGSRAETRRLPLETAFPHGVALDDRGVTAFVAFEGTPEVDGGVVAVDIRSGRVLWRAAVGRYVLGVAYLAD